MKEGEMKLLTATMMMVLSLSAFADCNQSLSQQVGKAPIVKLADGSQFVGYRCSSGCPMADLVNFCAEVAHNATTASVKVVRMAVNKTGQLIGNATQTSACFVVNAFGEVRAIACNLVGSGLGLAHNSIRLARDLTRKTISIPVKGLRRLRNFIFDGPILNQGQVCGCSIGAYPTAKY